MIKTIVFDLGGVLIDWNPRYVYRDVFDTEAEIDLFLTHITTMEWNVAQDAGRTLKLATQVLTRKHPEWAEEIKLYYDRWPDMLGGAIEGTVDILREIVDSKKYRVLALTNWSAETFPVAQKRYEFLGWFEGIVVSGEEKCRKPFPEIYKILFDRHNINPEEAIFIDDNPENVRASKELGMDAILFKSPKQLRSTLKRYLK